MRMVLINGKVAVNVDNIISVEATKDPAVCRVIWSGGCVESMGFIDVMRPLRYMVSAVMEASDIEYWKIRAFLIDDERSSRDPEDAD